MNLLTKVFIVLNLILSIAFSFFSLTLYAKKTDWIAEVQTHVAKYNELKTNTDKQLADLTKERDSFKELSVKAEETVKSRTEDLAKTNETLNVTRSTLSNLENEYKTLTANMTSIEGKYAKLDEQLGIALKERSAAVEAQQTAEKERTFAQNTAIEVSNDLKLTEVELRDANIRINALMTQILENRTMLTEIRKKVPNLDQILTASGPVRPLRGKVLRVEDAVDLVILSLGKGDDIKVGMRLVISRGDEYIGKVMVHNIYDEMCSATIDKEVTPKPIQVGDVAQTM